MAVPKQRRSKAKKRTKKACWKITAPQLRACPTCKALVVTHRACSECGTYKGKSVITIKEKTSKEKDA